MTQSFKPITARVSPRRVWLCSLSRQLWLSSVNVSRWNRQKVNTNFVDLNSTTTNSENTKKQKLNSARTLSIRSNGCLHCTQLGFKIYFCHCSRQTTDVSSWPRWRANVLMLDLNLFLSLDRTVATWFVRKWSCFEPSPGRLCCVLALDT